MAGSLGDFARCIDRGDIDRTGKASDADGLDRVGSDKSHALDLAAFFAAREANGAFVLGASGFHPEDCLVGGTSNDPHGHAQFGIGHCELLRSFGGSLLFIWIGDSISLAAGREAKGESHYKGGARNLHILSIYLHWASMQANMQDVLLTRNFGVKALKRGSEMGGL